MGVRGLPRAGRDMWETHIRQSLPFIVIRAALAASHTWIHGGGHEAFDVEAIYGKNVPGRRDFIIVEFNAWEYTGSEVLWAALITKIFDQVSFCQKSPVLVDLSWYRFDD